MKTLIIYSSQYGFTEKCARSLAKKLNEGADLMKLNPIKKPNLKAYERIIIGTPVYMGQINGQIRAFCENYLNQLLEKEVGIFICCGLMEQVNEIIGTSFPRQLLTQARGVEVLGGEIQFDKLRWYHKAMVNISGRVLGLGEFEENEPGFLDQNQYKLLKVMNG